MDETQFLAILIRDLPINVDEACIRAALTQYTNTDFVSLRMKKIELAGSRRYCLVQMKSLFDAVELFGKLEKISSMINNCKGKNFILYMATSSSRILKLHYVPKIFWKKPLSAYL